MMKKNLITFSLALLLAASNCSAARLVITNNSNETIWARINDQKRGSLSPEERRVYKRKLRTVIILAATGVGAAGAALMGSLDLKGFKNSPAFKKIKPGTNKVFHSGLTKPIKKVTFLKVIGSKTEKMKRNELRLLSVVEASRMGRSVPGWEYSGSYENKTMDDFYKKYGGIYAVSQTVEGVPSTAYVNMYNNIRKIYTADDIEVTFPVVKTFTIKPKIKAINLNAKISYEGWKKTKRY